MEVLVKNRAVETILLEIAEAFQALYPQRYARFMEVIQDEQTRLVKPTALSDEGTLLSLCKIPEDIYGFIKYQMRKRCDIPNFFADSRDYYLLCKVWSALRVKRRETTRFFKESKCPESQ